MSINIKQSRINFDKMGEIYPSAQNVNIHKEVIENINCYWFRNNTAITRNKLVIYLHGGAFALGSLQSHHALVSHLTQNLALPFLFIEYNLAPEKPFPNGLNDTLKVYKHLNIHYPNTEFILIGDSAGGGLAVSLLLELNEHKIQFPKFIVLLSPWLDLRCINKSMSDNADIDPILKKERLLEFASFYKGDQDISKVNPISNLVEKFPPTLIMVGSNEILLDDSKLIYAEVIKNQVNAELSVYEKQTHVWLLDNIDSVESQTAIKEIKSFLSS